MTGQAAISNKNNSVSIMLSIFIGIAATMSLQYFINFPVLLWILFSLGVVLISVIFIYYISDNVQQSQEISERDNIIEAMKIISIFLISFIPFSIQKLKFLEPVTQTVVENTKFEGPFRLPKNWFGVELIFTGSMILILSYIDKETSLKKRICLGFTGVLSILVRIGIWVIKIGGTI